MSQPCINAIEGHKLSTLLVINLVIIPRKVFYL